MKRSYIYLFLVISFLFVSCTSNKVLLKRVSDKHIIIEDTSLHNWLRLDQVNYFTREDSLLEAEVNFTNFATRDKKVSYKIEWIDKNGFILKSIVSKWTTVHLEKKHNLTIHGISPSIKAKDFKIRIQKPTNGDSLRKDSYHNEYQ